MNGADERCRAAFDHHKNTLETQPQTHRVYTRDPTTDTPRTHKRIIVKGTDRQRKQQSSIGNGKENPKTLKPKTVKC